MDIKGLVKEVGKVVKEGCGWNWEGVVLAVGLKQDVVPNLAVDAEEWEDFCREEGFEWVDGEGIGKNEFNGKFCSRLSLMYDMPMLMSIRGARSSKDQRGLGIKRLGGCWGWRA